MKHLIFAAALAAAAFAAPASAQVGLSVNVGEPNFYGHIDLGDAPAPRFVYRRPVVVQGEIGGRDPVYLHVRPGYEKNWRRHCGEYNACGEPVLFVRDSWYRTRYVPHYQSHRDNYQHRDNDRDHGDHHDHDHDNRDNRDNHH